MPERDNVPATPAPSQRSKQVPERTISDECKYCAEGEPEWSTDASCWIHRRPQLDKRCTRKMLTPIGELPAPSQPAGAREQVMKALDWWQQLERLEQRDAYRQRWANLALTLASHNDHDCDWMFRELERATSEITQRAEAAERERDSLRAELAALKAGKDEQK